MNSKIKFLSWALTALLMCANFTSCSDDDDDDEPFSSSDKSYAKPDAVDLGLPSGTLWATFNVGATSPEEYGDYFAWGELEPHYADGHSQDSPCSDWRDGYSGYNWDSYKFTTDGGSTFTKYTIDGKTELEDADDVAVKLLGGDWQMPTIAEWQELQNSANCTWEWQEEGNTTFSGVAGYKVTSKKEGYTDKYIFLPAAGHRGSYLLNAGFRGYYWSRSLDTGYSGDARYLYFNSGDVDSDRDYRSSGQSVRPVQRKN